MSDLPKIELDLERAAPPPAPAAPAPSPFTPPPARPYAPLQAPAYAVEPSYRTAALRVAGIILLLDLGLAVWLLGRDRRAA